MGTSAFIFLKDCICPQHIVTSTGARDFVNRVHHPYQSYFNNFISSFTHLLPSLKLMLHFSSARVVKMSSSRVQESKWIAFSLSTVFNHSLVSCEQSLETCLCLELYLYIIDEESIWTSIVLGFVIPSSNKALTILFKVSICADQNKVTVHLMGLGSQKKFCI